MPCCCGIDPLDNNTRLEVFGARITVSHQTARFLRKSAGESVKICGKPSARDFPQIYANYPADFRRDVRQGIISLFGQIFNDMPCCCGIDPLDNNTRLEVFGARITVSHQTARFLRKSAGEIYENLRETQRASGFAQILHRFFAQILHRFEGQIFRYAQDDNPH